MRGLTKKPLGASRSWGKVFAPEIKLESWEGGLRPSKKEQGG